MGESGGHRHGERRPKAGRARALAALRARSLVERVRAGGSDPVLLIPIAEAQRQLERALASSRSAEAQSPSRHELETVLGEVAAAQSRVSGDVRDVWDAWHFYVHAMMLLPQPAAEMPGPPPPPALAARLPDPDGALIALHERLACESAPSLAHAALLAELGALYGEIDDREAAVAAFDDCERELNALAAPPPSGEKIGREIHRFIEDLAADRAPRVPVGLEAVLALHRVYLRLYAGLAALYRGCDPVAARWYEEKLAAARAAARGGLIESLRRTVEAAPR